ncbi:MAG: AMP-binding protein, partial [Enterobacter roggenkampii]
MLLHHYLERNARRLPAKTAVCFKHQNLSYYELNGYANHIADCLTAEYHPSGHNIGLFLSKSIDAVASLYAVLKSGAAYVPLDVDAPWERTGYIMDDCRLRTIITEATQLLRLIKNCRMLPSSLNILCLGGLEQPDFLSGLPAGWQVLMCENQWFDVSAEFNSPEKTEDSLAYILYTSGSTGKPKGVMLSHRNGSTFAQWACQYVGLSAEDVFASHAPFYFDLSVFDIFASCYVGGTLCLLPPGMAWFGDAIADFIQDNAISIWYSVPSALLSLPAVLGDLRARLSSLRAVIYAGEAFDFHRLNQLRASLTRCDIYNFYGPTETNVITAYRLSHEHQEVLTENLPVGLPCPYAQIRVVGADLQPVGPGEEGELIVNGP